MEQTTSTSIWRIAEWKAPHGTVAELYAGVPIEQKGRQPVTYSIRFAGDKTDIEISAEDAKILIAALAAQR